METLAYCSLTTACRSTVSAYCLLPTAPAFSLLPRRINPLRRRLSPLYLSPVCQPYWPKAKEPLNGTRGRIFRPSILVRLHQRS
jgi:hypothetical protein